MQEKVKYEYLADGGYKIIPDGQIVDTSKLIGDHIIPIALGGEEWDINNIQTLCLKCNKIKTKEDMGKIKRQRKIEATLHTQQIGERILAERKQTQLTEVLQ